MLHREEKKDCGSPLLETGATPNPLAALPGVPSVPMPIKIEIPRPRDPRQPPPHPSPSSMSLGRMPGGVPNPMMVIADGPAPLFGDPPSTGRAFADDAVAATVADDRSSSSVPSPLASPIRASPLPAVASDDPPSRPSSAFTAGTSASTMDAMASAMDAAGESLDDGDRGRGDDHSEPPPARRRRANTIHWSTSQISTSSQLTSRLTGSPGIFQSKETLQPINFGDAPATRSSPVLGPWGQGRKLSNASSSASSLGLRTLSSGSLYSEYSYDSGSAVGSPVMGAAAACTVITGGTTNGAATKPAPCTSNSMEDKRQKRLERNRESARASRRRRKQYLEELEARVTGLSEEMDRGRMGHAFSAVKTVRGMRLARLREVGKLLLIGDASAAKGAGATAAGGAPTPVAARPGGIVAPVGSGIRHGVQSVCPFPSHSSESPSLAAPVSLEKQAALVVGPLSRASDELQIVQTFMRQQLSSLVQPTAARFVLWLSLQKDGFYRGGRNPSERLSAARIGERLLHSGTYRAAPYNGMWPLVCHEIGLSYDQEERIRQCQRVVLSNSEAWIHRHTALATQNVVEVVHTVMSGAQQAAKRREQVLMNILTPEQRLKFLAWVSRRSETIRKIAESKLKPPLSEMEGVLGEKHKTSPDRHVAANLYITYHKLSKVKQRYAPLKSFVHLTKLKKLSHRPSFESLSGLQGESDGNSKMTREGSFPSTGSLKRSVNDVLGTDISNNDSNSSMVTNSSQNGVTPESAQVAGQTAVMAVLKDVVSIMPKSALLDSQSPHYAAHLPQMVTSTAAPQVVAQPQFMAVQPPFAAPPKPKPQQRRSTVPYNAYPAQTITANVIAPGTTILPLSSVPLLDPDVSDIPMPTPVSVLLRTSDDFISPEPLEAMSSTVVHNTAPSVTVDVPELVTSHATHSIGGAVCLLGNRHQSAPQLGTNSASPPSEFHYPSLLPAPMAPIPESSVNNLPMGGVGGDITDFALEDLPEMDAGDWAIGEGFDMDVDENSQGVS